MKGCLLLGLVCSAVLSGFCDQSQTLLSLLPANAWDSNNTHQIVWNTEPGVQYELFSSTNLFDWVTVQGYPTTAVQYASASALNTAGTPDALFFRTMSYDEQAPVVVDRIPADGAFGVSRSSEVSVLLSDVSGVDPASISITVGELGNFTVLDAELSFTNNLLSFNAGGTPLGAYGTNVVVWLAVADVNGYTNTTFWAFDLERETITAGDIVVLGSAEAQASGQQLTPLQTEVFSTVYPGAKQLSMSSSSAPWVLWEVGTDYLIFAYSAGSPPSFQVGQFIANATPGRVDEIFYRKVVSLSDDPLGQRLTVVTEDVDMMDMLSQVSLFLTSPAGAVYSVAQDGLMVQSSLSVPVGNSFTHPLDLSGTPITCALNGNWEFVPEITLAFDIQGSALENFYFRFDGNSMIRLSPVITASGSYSTGRRETSSPILSTWRVYYIGQAGPVPIWVNLSFELNAAAEVTVDAEATFTTAIQRDDSFFIEALYRSADPINSRWSHSPLESTLTKDPFIPVISGHGEASAELIPQLEISLESLFGVYANLSPKIGLNGDAVLTNGVIESASFELYGQIDVNAGLSVVGLSNADLPSIDPWTLVRYPWLYEYPESVFSFVEHPENKSAELGDDVVFSCLTSSTEPVSYQWYHDGVLLPGRNRRTLSISSMTASHEGDYMVRAALGSEIIFSDSASLIIAAPFNMVRIPGGINSGTNPLGTFEFSLPEVHSLAYPATYSLAVDTFYMDATEITKAQWDSVVSWGEANGYDFISGQGLGRGGSHPVHTVSWAECLKWCNARSEMDDRMPCYSVDGTVFRLGYIAPENMVTCHFNTNGYRLPTSDEWEYAARGGLVSKRFPWGDTVSHSLANYHGSLWTPYSSYSYDLEFDFHPSYVGANPNPWLWDFPLTSPVGSFPPNSYGLYDMAGNVSEFCWDEHPVYDGRILHGGNWQSYCTYLRCGDLLHGLHDSQDYGFRCVRQE